MFSKTIVELEILIYLTYMIKMYCPMFNTTLLICAKNKHTTQMNNALPSRLSVTARGTDTADTLLSTCNLSQLSKIAGVLTALFK